MIVENISNDNEINILAIKYQKRFPKSNFLYHFLMLNSSQYMGLHLSNKEIKKVLKKSLKDGKIFQVWDYKWKEEMPCHVITGIDVKLIFKNLQ